MLTPRNPTPNHPILVLPPCPVPDQDPSRISLPSSLSRYAIFAAPIGDEEEDEYEPEEEEDHVDQQEEAEDDEDDYDDQVDEDGGDIDTEEDEEEEDEEGDDQNPDSGTLFLQRFRSLSISRTIQYLV